MTHADLVDFLRSIHARPGGTGALLNVLRDGKVHGAAELEILSEVVSDASLRVALSRHALDESRHAFRILNRMLALGMTPTRLPAALDRVDGLFAACRARDVRDVYEGRGWLCETELMELLIAVIIPEQEAVAKMQANLEALAGDPASQALIARMLRDDRRHVAYLNVQLNGFRERFSARAVAKAEERLRAAFDELTVTYYAALEGYLNLLANVGKAA